MITIYAEKPDVGKKIAAALGGFQLDDGTNINFQNMKSYDKAIKSQCHKHGFLNIQFQGEDAVVTWGYGHLCELCQAVDYDPDYKQWTKLPRPAFIPEQYQIKVKDSASAQFNIVKKLFKQSSRIINATDPDREGELIFYYLYTATNCKKPYLRAHFTSQTEEGIQEAFASLKTAKEVENITNAGRGRSVADWLVGSNLTVAMTLRNQGAGVLSVGRVQTPTLNMLVDRELAIRNFKPVPYYVLAARFTTGDNEQYTATHKTERFDNEAEAKAIYDKVNGQDGIVEDIKVVPTTRAVPSLFSLSTLQMSANAQYGFTLAKTLEVAQQLYEAGYTTYPRTDSTYLTDDMEPTVNKVLDMLSGNTAYNKLISGRPRRFDHKKYFDSSKVSSHFAIIPTHVIPAGMTPDQIKIYDLIAKSVIMMLYPPAKINQTTITTTVNGEPFITKGNAVADPGWLTVAGIPKDVALPNITKGEYVSGEYKIDNKMTEPPKHYTDKTLVSAMISAGKDLDDESLKKVMEAGVKGIGTEATRASIIETLIQRGYAERQKKSIIATDKGIALIQAIPLNEFKSAELTARWEDRLNKIADGKDSYESFVKDIEQQTCAWCAQLYELPATIASAAKSRPTVGTCPLCGKDLIMYDWGVGCTGYKAGCRYSISKTIAGKKLTDAQIKSLLTKGETSLIKGFKSKAGKKFDAIIKLDNSGRTTFVFPENNTTDTNKRQGTDRDERVSEETSNIEID